MFQNIPNLIILDLYGNPLSVESHYRLFLIYHLQNLKVLDGQPVVSFLLGFKQTISSASTL